MPLCCILYLTTYNKFIPEFYYYILPIYLHDSGFGVAKDYYYYFFYIAILENYRYHFATVKLHLMHCVLTVLAVNIDENTHVCASLVTMLQLILITTYNSESRTLLMIHFTDSVVCK